MHVSDRIIAGFTGSDPNGLFDIGHKNLAVADLFGASGRDNGLNRGIDLIIGQHDFDFYFWQKIHHIFGTAIKFGVALLPAKALDFYHRQALNSCFLQSFLDLVKLEGLDNRLDFFHGRLSLRTFRCSSDHFLASATIAER